MLSHEYSYNHSNSCFGQESGREASWESTANNPDGDRKGGEKWSDSEKDFKVEPTGNAAR